MLISKKQLLIGFVGLLVSLSCSVYGDVQVMKNFTKKFDPKFVEWFKAKIVRPKYEANCELLEAKDPVKLIIFVNFDEMNIYQYLE